MSPFSVSAVCLLILLLSLVQVGDATGDLHALRVVPGPGANAVARVDGGMPAEPFSLR